MSSFENSSNQYTFHELWLPSIHREVNWMNYHTSFPWFTKDQISQFSWEIHSCVREVMQARLYEPMIYMIRLSEQNFGKCCSQLLFDDSSFFGGWPAVRWWWASIEDCLAQNIWKSQDLFIRRERKSKSNADEIQCHPNEADLLNNINSGAIGVWFRR